MLPPTESQGFRPLLAIGEWTLAITKSTLGLSIVLAGLPAVLISGVFASLVLLAVSVMVGATLGFAAGLLVVIGHVFFGSTRATDRRDHGIVVGATGAVSFIAITSQLSRTSIGMWTLFELGAAFVVVGIVNLAATGMRYRYLHTPNDALRAFRTGGDRSLNAGGGRSHRTIDSPHHRMEI